jgi:hypothetical protein
VRRVRRKLNFKKQKKRKWGGRTWKVGLSSRQLFFVLLRVFNNQDATNMAVGPLLIIKEVDSSATLLLNLQGWVMCARCVERMFVCWCVYPFLSYFYFPSQ